MESVGVVEDPSVRLKNAVTMEQLASYNASRSGREEAEEMRLQGGFCIFGFLFWAFACLYCGWSKCCKVWSSQP